MTVCYPFGWVEVGIGAMKLWVAIKPGKFVTTPMGSIVSSGSLFH